MPDVKLCFYCRGAAIYYNSEYYISKYDRVTLRCKQYSSLSDSEYNRVTLRCGQYSSSSEMGRAARNPGGTGGRGYSDYPQGVPDSMMLASVQRMCKLEPQGGKSGVEVVPSKEFNRRKLALEEEKGAPMQRRSWGLPRHLAYPASQEAVLGLLEMVAGGGHGELEELHINRSHGQQDHFSLVSPALLQSAVKRLRVARLRGLGQEVVRGLLEMIAGGGLGELEELHISGSHGPTQDDELVARAAGRIKVLKV